MNNPCTLPQKRWAWATRSAGACAIVVFITAALAILCADVVHNFFPYAEEWKLLRPSLPWLAHPLQWFQGFATVTNDPYPAWSVAAVNFWRPVMHLVYWVNGALFGQNWGAYLYSNFVFLSMAAGALYWWLRSQSAQSRDGARESTTGPWFALALVAIFILMPPMVSATSYFLPILVPQFAFGGLVAALCLLAGLGFVGRHYLLATLLLSAALVTKEQALPMALALPLTYAWHNRRNVRTSLPTLTLLAAPALVWIGLRLVLFGSLSQGVYVLTDTSASLLHSLVTSLLKLPLYTPALSSVLQQPLSVAALLVACNLLVLIYLGADTLKRWWHQGPEVVSVAFIGYWGFLALVDLNPRYGTLIIALAIIMLARRPATGIPRAARNVALTSLIVTGLTHGALSWCAFPTQVAFAQDIYQVGRDYAAALADTSTDTKVIVVLNDPNTVYTAPSDMAKVLKLPVTTVYKASDYPWQWPKTDATQVPKQPCEISVSAPDPATVILEQSCGLQIAGALVPYENPPVLPVAQDISAEFPQAQFNNAGFVTDLGQRLVLHIRRPGVRVLYFDPANRSFHWLPSFAKTEANIAKPRLGHE